MGDFASLTQADYRCGRNHQLKFDPTVFWANAAIMARFPLHTIVARVTSLRYFMKPRVNESFHTPDVI